MIILASASPRRQELLKIILTDYIVEPPEVDETITEEIDISATPEYLARKKALNVAEKHGKNDLVIGCDTGVFINNKMLGKPIDIFDAKNMLQCLSGRTHKVITGCCIVNGRQCLSFSVSTIVEFYKLSDKEIDNYIKTGEPMDKAGSYAIQGKGAAFVKRIDGDFYNVVGLPVGELYQKLKDII